ncbi:PREDICTED: uncharacterized protein LOC105313996 [Amphimedon queenslandica]|uniref:Uncharacterized protein n=1 Tax=Amphimedon queenslandica TaxID=400682 RepID=A0A1X7U3V0_AMPQE|nr:PREDICTED: uncharacterized protein LOC105313996 [Amphimedon queenslandica]|eukprot:XP_011406167.1 PREDICTED: uncharacterized protein LOC105313996 [Amphimedon queenslandica]
MAAKMVYESFFVDDGLIGADSIVEAIHSRKEMQELFAKGGFLLRKSNYNVLQVLESIEPDLIDTQEVHTISDPDLEYTKTLGLERNVRSDCFCITVSKTLSTSNLTKCTLVSNIAKVFDVLGLFSSTTIKIKILLQRLWESKVGWDELAPAYITEVWLRWESELKSLSGFRVPRYYFPEITHLHRLQLHGFSDASEDAYVAVVYFRSQDLNGTIGTSIVLAKSRVAPIERLSIPRLKLCGALMLSQLLHYLKNLLKLSISQVYA